MVTELDNLFKTKKKLSDFSDYYILLVLGQQRFHRQRTSEVLNISVITLKRKIDEWREKGWVIPDYKPIKKTSCYPKPKVPKLVLDRLELWEMKERGEITEDDFLSYLKGEKLINKENKNKETSE